MRIVVQIPCFNEEETIGQVIAEIRDALQGYDDTSILIIDDGSTDNTVAEARKAGADYVARHFTNHGLFEPWNVFVSVSVLLIIIVGFNSRWDRSYITSPILSLCFLWQEHNPDNNRPWVFAGWGCVWIAGGVCAQLYEERTKGISDKAVSKEQTFTFKFDSFPELEDHAVDTETEELDNRDV